MTRLTADAPAAGPGAPVVVPITGPLDLRSAPVLHETLARHLIAEPQLVVFDVAAVTDPADDAVVAFTSLADRAHAWPGADVVLGGASATVATRLGGGGRIPVYPTVPAALAGATALSGGRRPAGPPRQRLGLQPTLAASAAVRRLVDRACVQWGLPAMRDAVRLVATELVSNAVRHAATALEVTLSRRSDAVHLSVRDRSAVLPRQGGPVPPTVVGGRGLHVVEVMSRSWGATPTRDGKAVWASLAT